MPLQQLGRLSKGDPGSKDFAFYGLNGGINVKSAPQTVADNELTVGLEGYLRADGGFQMRNGMYIYNATATGGTGQLILARFYQDVLSGAVVNPETTALLGQVGNTLYSIPSSGAWTTIGSIWNGSLAALPMSWVMFQNPNDPHFTGGLTDVMVICTGSGGPYVYDGTNLYTPSGWSSASGARWLAVVNGILWFGGIRAYPNQIFGTGDGITASFESLPAYRNFVFDSPVMGLCAQGTGSTAALVVGKNVGLSVLYGTGPNTFYVQDVPMNDGVAAGRTMIYDSGVVYFFGQRAMWAFDGQTVPVSISDKIEPWILNDPFYQGPGNYPVSSSNYAWTQIYNNRLHFGYISGTSTVPNTLLMYDIITRGWTVSQPNGGLSSMILLNAPSDPNPYTAYAGSATTGLPMQWDYVPLTTTNAIYDDAPNNTVPVLASVQTKYFKIGEPGTTKALMRFYPEMLVSGNFSQPFTVITDQGASTASTLLDQVTSGTSGAIWDSSTWDASVWGGGGIGFLNFGPPASRLDFPGVEAESFSFGITMNAASSPWIWSGGSGVFGQRSRT